MGLLICFVGQAKFYNGPGGAILMGYILIGWSSPPPKPIGKHFKDLTPRKKRIEEDEPRKPGELLGAVKLRAIS